MKPFIDNLHDAIENVNLQNLQSLTYDEIEEIERLARTVDAKIRQFKMMPAYYALYEAHLAEENKKHVKKAQSRAKLSKKRYYETMKAVEEGFIVPGAFIKVTGARDGAGYREVVRADEDRKELICRQWRPVSVSVQKRSEPDVLRSNGYVKLDNKWLEPQAQMTTHGYDKVAKIFGL